MVLVLAAAIFSGPGDLVPRNALTPPLVAATQQQSARAADRLAAQADEARLANRPDEAIALYRKALAARHAWAEGWWSLGTLLYERDSFADAAGAFREVTSLNPKAGTAWVMLGLCEFSLGRHGDALVHIQKGRRLGFSADQQFRHVMLYHEGVLLLGKSEFEQAQETLGLLSADGVESEELTIALGQSVLRLRPSDLREGDPAQREVVRRAGRAESLAAQNKLQDALREYEALAAAFPRASNVHYALGRYFVARSQPDQALAAYQAEIRNFPEHVPALLGIAAIMAETDPAGALPYAEAAVRLNTRVPLGHYILGSLLLHTDQIDRAIEELTIAERSVKNDPGVYYALGRAYARAGRKEEAARAWAVFKRLTEERQRTAIKVPAGKSQR